MKVVILAGGFGTRLAEETHSIPKPMVEIGGKPILWHIMKIYSTYGFNDFVICLGYKGYVIKEYFANYFLHNSDVTIDIKNNSMEIHNNYSEPWKVTLVDTGLNTMTGGRLKRVAKYLDDETFMLTYGDGVGNINIKELIEFHRSHGKLATVTATQPEGRFGALKLENNKVTSFAEKMDNKDSWINGGFFVLEPEVINYIKDDNTIWEREPLEKLSKDGELMAYFHDGFWKPMDKLKDKMDLEEMWNSGNAPWKVWGE
jgi:glucose-1-phosphate cytidylyltransferase